MNQRLQQFLTAENLSQSQFADKIGVARAGVSHILAGRNRPGFDFIENMARCFPTLNLEWLILGKGKMYKTTFERREDEATDTDIFTSIEQEHSTVKQEQTPIKEDLVLTTDPKPGTSRIGKVLVLFNDGTFQELK